MVGIIKKKTKFFSVRPDGTEILKFKVVDVADVVDVSRQEIDPQGVKAVNDLSLAPEVGRWSRFQESPMLFFCLLANNV